MTLKVLHRMGFYAVYNNVSVISGRQSSSTHLCTGFLTTVCPSNLPLFFSHRLSTHLLLSNVRKNVDQAGVQTHDPWIDNPHSYHQSYRGSARPLEVLQLKTIKDHIAYSYSRFSAMTGVGIIQCDCDCDM